MTFAKSACLAGLLVLGALTASAQTYWSTAANLNCGNYGTDTNGTPRTVTTPTNGTGYVCLVVGTLPWFAAGAGWGSSIRASAPPTAPVAMWFDFTDTNGAALTLDFQYKGDSTMFNDVTASQALFANQPIEVDLFGLHSQAPSYTSQAGGAVVVTAYCPDADTCSQVQAQLIYSALPSKTWSLSAPVVWDAQTWTAWSSVGIDDGGTDQVSFVIYNLADDGAAHSYTLNVYDASGNLYSTGTTAAVPYLGSYADVLRNVVSKLPAGAFKLQLVAAATQYVSFEVLQFHGATGTTLVSAWEDTVPSTNAASATTASRHLAPARSRRLLPSRTVLR